MAEHGRNLGADARASIAIVGPGTGPDPLAGSRVTLAGAVERPCRAELAAAREAHLAAVPAANYYIDYSDFSLWILRVHRVRWVGGYGRMDSATGEEYMRAQPDPIAPHAAAAIAHLNADHSDSLCLTGQTLGGYPDTTAAACTGADRYGLDLRVSTPRGVAYTRVGFGARINSIGELRSATVELVRRAGAVERGAS
jgi:putative heme iron utilization protein